MRFRRYFGLTLLSAALSCSAAASDRFDDLQDAAEKRVKSGLSYELQADIKEYIASEIIKIGYSEKEKKARLVQIADCLNSAASLDEKAYKEFMEARDNKEKAAQESKDEQERKDLREEAESFRNRAQNICREAARLYERASGAYAEAGLLERKTEAGRESARCLELLAGKKQ
jgi:hypothetical protein